MTSASTIDWTRLSGSLLECAEQAANLYSYTTREDQGEHDWRVVVKGGAIGSQDGEDLTPQGLVERIRPRPEATYPAILEHDRGWLGQELEGHWVFAKLYLIGSTVPVALIYRIDFEDESEGNHEQTA